MPADLSSHAVIGAIARALVAATGVFGAVGIVYVVATFALMRAHTEARSPIASLRAAMREIVWVLVTQPFVPLFYVIGRRMGRGRGKVPVVFVHGYMQNRVDFVRLARALAKGGAGALYGFNYSWLASVPTNARRLAEFVDQVCRECNVAKVDLVCHSLGGLVAIEMVRDGGAARVRRCATIATPHAGIAWRGPILGACSEQLRAECEFLRGHAGEALLVPCLSIYSTHDNIVHPPETSSLAKRGGLDQVVEGASHLAILFSPEVAAAVVAFLAADANDPGDPKRSTIHVAA